ncbi:uncharacterized protein LOC114520816 [Dendronephthya gigantea]|uniref:uncharacterized protein LOC114520816 n=1 Tax=Dendronephthya gigantea TaxID=151771 RepID=UPI00106D8164|nr:uncharacterized protein LOC114520816 [Dendronephthya gigantea]
MANKKTSSTRGRRKGKRTPSSAVAKADEQRVCAPADVLIPETSLNNARHVPELSKSPTQPSQNSHNSSALSSETNDDFTSFRRADSKEKNKQKRAKKNPYNLSATEEELMLEFIMDNPVLWNVKMTDYRRKDKKEKIWEEQAHQMNKTVDILKGWFRSLRDTHTRLDKKKSGDIVLQT